MLVSKLRSFPGEIRNCPLYIEGKERSKKEVGHAKLVGGSFNKQGSLHVRLVLGDGKTNRSLYLPARILYRDLLWVQSSRWFQQHIFLLRPSPWKLLQLWELWYIPRTGETGEEPLIVRVQLMGKWLIESSPWPLVTVQFLLILFIWHAEDEGVRGRKTTSLTLLIFSIIYVVCIIVNIFNPNQFLIVF